MTLMKTFRTPIIVYPDVKTGCKFIAVYTIAISIFLMATIVHMQNGGKSTQTYCPLFEANLSSIVGDLNKIGEYYKHVNKYEYKQYSTFK